MLSENAFKEMPTLADKSSDFRFSSGIQVYFWTQRPNFRLPLHKPNVSIYTIYTLYMFYTANDNKRSLSAGFAAPPEAAR